MSKQKQRNVEAIYALSPMQHGMLFHSLYAPEESPCAVQFACTLSGKVNPEALQQAWQEVVNRHSVLRTFFVWQDLKEPVQIVRQHVPLPWLSRDWSTLAPAVQQQQLSEFLTADFARGFDLQHAPLMRLALIQVANETYYFVWSFHHLLLDGWSTARVIKEVFTFYEGLSQGRRVELEAVQPYREYIRWLRGQEMHAAEQFWHELLKGFSAPTILGIERRIEAQGRSEDAQERFVVHHVRLTAEATGELKRLARTQQVTLNTVVQGAWALLLSRYSGSEDVVFGVTVSGRPATLPGVEEMVGLFINTLPVRVAVKSDEGVGEYLRSLQEQQVEVRQYEYSPLPEVQRWSEVPKGMPLFENLIAFENYPVGEVLEERSGGLEVHDIRNREWSSYPLALVAAPLQELELKAVYDSWKYDAKTITRMMEHLEVVLQGLGERPTASLADVSLLTDAERRHLLLEWNETDAAYPLSSCIHHLFEAQVRRSPHAVAAHAASASLTFAELDQRANQLAHYLLESGIGPQAVVALLLDHSCETLIAILGVLKAGCAYLPLDPSHPPARMAFALADAQARLLITTHSLSERLAAGIAAHLPSGNGSAPPVSSMPPVLALDTDWQRCAALPATAPSLSLSSATAAYLIYTSGSTGIPKGVVIEHASLVNYICWAQSVYLKEPAACALYSSLAFDLTVTSIFLPLVSGNTLHLYPQQDAGPSLLEVMEDNRCQLLKLTPSHLALICNRDNRDSQIRWLIVGGEALSTELAHAVSESFGHQVEIYNEYGPTEATVGCMIYRFDPKTEQRAWVPIGRPAGNTQIYILDKRLEPTAEHVTGELYIGGAGMARGYLGRAELTAERFIPDPFSGVASARLYRTGDRARRLADGNIEYLGRNDEQVKYHGYRVELNELRLALSAHARVREAVVVVRKDSGREQLVGYYVGREAIEAEELRRHMQERVIAETVPQLYVHLQWLPLTLNGKVNVEALPAPWVEENGAGKEVSGEARTAAEAQLVAIWQEVLGREQVRIDDNFYELGGDSILSIQIIARANRAGLQLTPRQLFKHPTVAELAAVAGTAPATVSEQGEVSGAAPLTPIQHWFFEQELAAPAHYNQSLLLQTRRQLQAEALKAAVRGLLSQHDALRLRFERDAEGWRQWHVPLSEELVAQSCTVIELSSVADEELGAAITATAEEAQRSLNLQHGPLLRVVWIETGAGRSGRLLLVAHHLVVDGVSWRVLLEDLERGYEQAAGGEAVELGAKTSSYREWAEALVAEAERGLGVAEEQYWTAVARAEVVELPGGNRAGGGTVGSARRVEVGLSAERTRRLLQEVPAAYNTQINDVLVTALARTLSWWTTKAHRSENGAGAAVLVELEGHGREEVSESVDVSRTVGWFTSIYPVVLESKVAEEAGAALKRVKEQLRAVPRRGLGYGLLRYLGNGEVRARLGTMRQAQVGFNYLGQLDQVVGEERWLGLATESAGAEREGSGQRVHAIEVNGFVVGGELRMGWAYDADQYQQEEMEAVAERSRQELEELIAHCVSEEAGGFTPSDFPLANLDQRALDQITANDGLISDIYTLAPLQAGLLFHSLYTPSSGEYFVQLTCTLSGKVSPEALQQAWQEVVNRHSVLRTFFVWQDLKEPVQIVRQHVPLPWLPLDWRTLAPALQQQQLSEFLTADVACGFDLQQAPLMRLALIRVEDETYHFVWSFHHLLLDGWSTARVIKEVFTFYEGLSQGRAVELEAVQPYREYIRWLRGQEMETAEQFWRELLKGFSVPTALGIERVVSTVGDRYEQQEVRLTAEATAELQQLARTHQVTLNTVVQGAWALLLSRYSGSEDVVFGATVSGRPASLAGVEEMVGMFINTLPVRVAVQSKERIGEYLRRLQEQQVEVRQYEYSPLVEVQRWSEVPKGSPLFETLIAFENYPVGKALEERRVGLEVRDVRNTERNSYPLALVAIPLQELALIAIYDSWKYGAKTITRMMEHLEVLLQEIVERPTAPLSELSLLTEAERRQLLLEWNETDAAYPLSSCIHHLFEAQVRRSPHAVAVHSASVSLTFAELDQRANQLAHFLLDSGIDPQAVVALLLDHSCETLIAIFGVLKAGCAYLPLDPSHPPARMAFALADAQASLLITTHSLSERLGAGIAAHLPTPMPPMLALDTDWQRCAALPATAPSLSLSSATAAYVIYTSGSTGIPKGVVIEHASLVNYICWAQSVYLKEPVACALYSSLAFDLTVTSIFLPLVSGNALHLYPQQDAGRSLLEVMKDNCCQLLKLTPSHLALISDRNNRDSQIRCLIVGGEALSTELAHAVSESFGQQVEIYNEYGPTEATVGCMIYRYDPETEERAWVPIGRPAANTQIYVLDERLEPTAEHVTGELYIGGAGVARGYLGRAELTAERFIPDPFSGVASARLYRTGDRARRLADGNIEYLGRNDEQVKYHGYRVELNELRLALSAHERVRDAVVVLRKDGAGGREQLVGYYVSREAIEAKELRRHMQERVIAETVPQLYVHLRRLPLTLNGKVNVEALPAPWVEENGAGKKGSGEPRTAAEAQLVAIWREVLGREQMRIDDNFFELGGHSLLATQVISRVRDAFGQEVALHSLFEQPTVAGLAREIEVGRGLGVELQAPPLVRVSRDEKLPLSFAQQRLWFLDQLEPGSAFYNIPSAIQVSGVLKVDALERALSEIVRRHEVLRTTFAVVDGEPQQIVWPAEAFPLPVTDLSALSREEKEAGTTRFVREEAQRPFDLEHGPLLRVSLLRLQEEEHVALVTMHHIVSDGWSMGIFIHEVAALYNAFITGQESPLEELPIQYADFAHWQRTWLQGEVLAAQLAYWREELADAPTVIDLPIDKPRPPVQTYNGAYHPLQLSAELSTQLRELSRRHGSTLFMTLLAAYDLLLCRYAGQEQVLVGTPIANRNRSETEGLIGFFVNTLVLRGDVRGNPGFGELLRRVRETALGAYAHQDLPFEKLVEELQPERDMSRSPLFQVMFILQNAAGEVLELEGLSLSEVGSAGATAKFELTLALQEQGGVIVGGVEYNRDLYEAETIGRLAASYERVLRAVVADAEQGVFEIELLSEAERRQLIEEWNETAAAYPRELSLSELFEEQVARRPAATALVYGAQQFSYGELNERANRLAHYLLQLAVQAEARVGILLERTPALLVSLLGVLKAGGCYVPLDPQYPQERLEFMRADAGLRVLLTTRTLARASGLEENDEELRLVYVEEVEQAGSSENPRIAISAEQLAYLIYTSGSTGVPKGIAITQGSAATLMHWASASFERAALSGVLFSTSICFDLSIFELFVTLSNGGQVIVAENALQLPALAAASEVTLINTVPSAMAELVRMGAVPASVRVVNLAGEALRAELVAEIYAQTEVQAVYNLYGPSEDTTYSTYTLVRAGERVSIGRPIRNTRAYVLDQQRQVVPVGVSGELYLGGAGLARGYWQRPELTAAHFIPDHLSGAAGGRLYRTGDRVRYLASGELEFLERMDHQVKLRGYRIELGEIESVLASHAAVAEAVVVMKEDQSGEKRLVAYVVGENQPASSELRSYLRERVPEYMVPAGFVKLERLPLTANGKVDRGALPAPEGLSLGLGSGYLAPRTAVEEIVAGIWGQLLGVERIGVADNFFELGGHSLLATRVLSRVRDAFGQEVALRSLFEQPTVAGLAREIEAGRGLGAELQAPALVRVSRDEELPLSFAQQRLWFLDQLEPGSAFYNIPAAVRLRGTLNIEALERTLSEVVRRHEMLRTHFIAIDGEPVQVIEAAAPVRLEVLDLSGLDEAERTAETQRLVAEESARPFDLMRGPLLRVSLIRFDEEEHVALVTMHHIVSDGWSIGILVREVAALYDAFITGQESPLEELPIQYADFAHWQRTWLQGEVLAAQLAYWREELADVPAVIDLPIDKPRPPVQTYNGAFHPLQLSAELSTQLRELSHRHSSTLFMTLLAAYDLLLCRYAGQEQVLVGTPIANRNRSETEGLIGFFVNTLVLRGDVRGNPSFRELLRRVKESALGAYAHQDLPFEKLVEELQPERDMSRSPLFQVIFVLQNAADEVLELEGLSLSEVESTSATAKFELTLALQEQGGVIVGGVSYNRDLYEAETIGRLVASYERVLQAVVADAEQGVFEIELLSEAERRQLIEEWNEPEQEYAPALTLSELFEAQVARTPEAVALLFDDTTLSYRELNERANQLAHYLQRSGVGPDVLVGILMERSVEMMVAVLGILKAGGAYVPLDPTYPAERLAFMVQDSGMRVLLTQERWSEVPGAYTGATLSLSEEWDAIAGESTENLARGGQSEHLAYVIYTSGSTGRPKGVLITHANVVRLLEATQVHFEFNERDVWTLFHSYAFDFSVWEIWGALAYGGKLAIVPYWSSRSAEAFHRLLVSEQVTVLNQTPSAFRQLMAADEAAGAEVELKLRLVIFGGEALELQSLRPWFARHGDQRPRLVNMFGITETTVHVSYRPLRAADLELAASSVIGRPLGCLQVYLLDGRGQPVPVGVGGEICVGGTGLARGYLNQAELTAARFVPNPFSTTAGARLYKSGDLGRYLANGDIEYLGRIDQQVKVRGFRIELGEIEAVLASHAAVAEAVVVLKEDQSGEKRLVAYVVGEATGATLREYLRERVPEYMVPAAFVRLERLPLTVNGKVDRGALPAAGELSLGLGSGYLAPRTAVEEIVASIWGQLLGVERIGVADNFFELGGHSLLATQVISRVRDAFGQEVALRRLFEQPTVAGLAREIEAGRGLGVELQAPPLVRVSRDEKLPLSFAQQRLWFLDQLEPGSAFYNIPSAIQLSGVLKVDALERALSEIVRRHEVLRTTILQVEGEPQQIIWPAEPFPLPVTDLSALSQEEREAETSHFMREEAQRPFDLENGPLLRVRVLCLGAAEHVALVTMHHIVSDGWSMGIFINEVAALYGAYVRGEESPLEELAIQYADFAHWQRTWLQGEVLAAQLAYWREELADVPTVIDLPIDKPRPPVQTYNGAHHRVEFSPDLSAQLRELSRRHGSTLFMTLLAAYDLLLCRYAGQEQVLVGTPIANRNRSETEGLIGFFVNTLVLRGDVRGNPSFRELLRRVRETSLSAHAHQDLPFEKLVEELQPERDMSRSPLFQVTFILQNAADEVLELEGLSLSEVGSTSATAKFELTLALQEQGGVIVGGVEYNRDLYEAETIGRLVASYERVLQAVVADPEQRVLEIELLSEAERRQIIEGWNEAEQEYAPALTLSELFEAQVARIPEAVALLFDDTTLSYRELNERANQLAHYLQRSGVGPDVLVGILMERSVEMMVAVLGILKAGGAYVPLDPTYPAERLAFMVQDSGMRVLLTQERWSEVPGAYTGATLSLSEQWDAIAGESTENLARGGQSEHLAYVIYTSGSTGRPKGVLITHANVVRLLEATQVHFEFNERDVWTLFHSYAFDFSVWEIWGALAYGGKLVIVPYWSSRSAEAFHRLLVSEQVTVLNQTPSAFRQLMAADEAAGAEVELKLRLVIFGGEALELQSLRPWFARHGDQRPRLVNMFGITETTVHVSYRPLRAADLELAASSVIGRPLGCLQVYLLDGRGQPVPVGVGGEICVGGTGLARGYLNQAELTAARFVPNPFSTTAGARLYKSGDLGRYLANGDIEYLGRIDQQVKVRGFRIELGEIESTLNEHPAVQNAVVIAREEKTGSKRLVAYIVPDQRRAGPISRLLSLEEAGQLKDLVQFELPNEMTIVCRNRTETEFIYDEIFAKQTYLNFGITVPDDACIFDVGANIGLFTLFASQLAQRTTIYSFEPIPPVFQLLRLNTEIYGLNVKLFECGLANESGASSFTYYPNVSVISGRFADARADSEVVKTFVRQQQEGRELPAAQLDELIAGRLTSENFTCQLKTLSEVMRDEGVSRIDLLKIDVEKGELEVLGGIDDADWSRIDQVVVEVHDLDERVRKVTELLSSRGFTVHVQQDAALEQTNLYNLYASRNSNPLTLDKPAAEFVWSSRELLVKELRERLKKSLPEYMAPQAFVALPALPLTSNGKIDRRALQALAVEFEAGAGGQSVMARTPVEEILTAIWAEVLGRKTVSVYDNFFELGGHSLLATQVISRVRDAFGQEVALRSLFEQPTVAGLAREIEAGRGLGAELQAPPLVRVSRDEKLPLSFAQQRLWSLDQLEPGSTFYNIPSAIQVRGVLKVDALERALNEIVRRHEVLRTTILQVEGEPQQIIWPAEPFPLPVTDLSELPDEERRAEMMRLIAEEAERPFDLMRGPLLRVNLVRISEDEHTALLTKHHIVSDGWSIAIFIREMAALYTAYCAGQPSPLAELPIQYADFAYWQRQWFQGEMLERQLSYWRRQLAGAPTVLELPTAKSRSAVRTFRAATQAVRLSREAAEGLKALSKQTGVTLYMSLLAAFDVLLYRYGGQTDLLIGTPIANRNRSETEALIGFFINTLVLRMDLSGDPTFIEVLQRVREVTLEAYAHQELPFEKLVEELQPDRNQTHSPLVQVMFVLQNIEVDIVELPGLSLGIYPEENRTAQFDLLLTMWESNDGMGGFLRYNADLFEDITIANMVEHFQTLIENLLADPQQHLSNSSFLTEDETMGLTSADFRESGLSQKDFESLILQLNSSSSLK